MNNFIYFINLSNFPLNDQPKNPRKDLEYVHEYLGGPNWDFYIRHKNLYVYYDLYLSVRSIDPEDEVYYIQ